MVNLPYIHFDVQNERADGCKEKKRKEIECWKVSAPVPFFSLSFFPIFIFKKDQVKQNVYMILLEGTEIIAEIKGDK